VPAFSRPVGRPCEVKQLWPNAVRLDGLFRIFCCLPTLFLRLRLRRWRRNDLDGYFVQARRRHVASKRWSERPYLDMDRLRESVQEEEVFEVA